MENSGRILDLDRIASKITRQIFIGTAYKFSEEISSYLRQSFRKIGLEGYLELVQEVFGEDDCLLASSLFFRKITRDPRAIGIECRVFVSVPSRDYNILRAEKTLVRLPSEIQVGVQFKSEAVMMPNPVFASEELFDKYEIPEGTQLGLATNLMKAPITVANMRLSKDI